MIRISYSDIRRINTERRDVETYLGIERPLRNNRVAELKDYVNTADANFPSPIILAIAEEHTELDRETGLMRIKVSDDVAKILDGQHRIAGLEGFKGDNFDVLVTIFLEMDIEYQALVFATINLEQTKVNKSLAYDLCAYATTRSPQKTCIVRLQTARRWTPFYSKIVRFWESRRQNRNNLPSIVYRLTFAVSLANKDRDALRSSVSSRAIQGVRRTFEFS